MVKSLDTIYCQHANTLKYVLVIIIITCHRTLYYTTMLYYTLCFLRLSMCRIIIIHNNDIVYSCKL